MSTVKAVSFQHPSSSTPAITLDSTGAMTGSFPYPNRNLLYNGAMQINQRSISVSGITGSGYNTADRWKIDASSLGTWTQSIENDAPSGSGFRKSLKMLCTTASASPAAASRFSIFHLLEGQDLQRIAKGTSSAQQLTLSFWVKSNVTGTYVTGLYDNDNTRGVAATYTISTSANWEKKTITFPADVTGILDNDNGDSLELYFHLAMGSNFTSGTLATTWATYTNANWAVGQTNLAANVNNYWQITGVQLETGSVATPFEFKSYGQELRECQRYYYLHASGTDAPICTIDYYSASQINGFIFFPATMRTNPAIVVTTGTNYYDIYRNGTDDFINGLVIGSFVSTKAAEIRNNTEASGTAGQAGRLVTANASAYLAFNAEL